MHRFPARVRHLMLMVTLLTLLVAPFAGLSGAQPAQAQATVPEHLDQRAS